MTDDDLLELDGGAGGGQLVRTALALSTVADRPFRMTNVRGDRPTPGLKPQHLAAVDAAAQLCDAEVSGAELGAEELTFRPGSPTGGRVTVDIGTAGSVALLFDALLPVALRLDRPLAVTATGGTDVKWSPTTAHYRRVKLPLVREVGVHAAVECDRTGFYPAGGGEATLWLAPASRSDLTELDLTERGDLTGVRILSTASTDLADADVAERQAVSAVERLREADAPSNEISVVERTLSSVETASPGSALAVVLDYERTTAGFDALGERGKSAEAVGRKAAERALAFLESDGDRSGGKTSVRSAEPTAAAVDSHTGDQLVVFLALAGGKVAIPEVTDHVRTCVDLVTEFGFEVGIDGRDGDLPPVLTAPGERR
ncbi:RNA 3'-terminal phosphate cyclase (plasmid) [Halorussus limi]|uniref:RNA 3'-terminal phosphate cyclase n=1 Tax=Halorussus limi TaxID=2938695 RepID=A0A8U0I051_9EURY|nr:RNA 3'-terminal phosphate cyclase [Halorussus limi]UPV76558.1 RNA 3'-terminal phosphate cyclase [Halorussus limi]